MKLPLWLLAVSLFGFGCAGSGVEPFRGDFPEVTKPDGVIFDLQYSSPTVNGGGTLLVLPNRSGSGETTIGTLRYPTTMTVISKDELVLIRVGTSYVLSGYLSQQPSGAFTGTFTDHTNALPMQVELSPQQPPALPSRLKGEN